MDYQQVVEKHKILKEYFCPDLTSDRLAGLNIERGVPLVFFTGLVMLLIAYLYFRDEIFLFGVIIFGIFTFASKKILEDRYKAVEEDKGKKILAVGICEDGAVILDTRGEISKKSQYSFVKFSDLDVTVFPAHFPLPHKKKADISLKDVGSFAEYRLSLYRHFGDYNFYDFIAELKNIPNLMKGLSDKLPSSFVFKRLALSIPPILLACIWLYIRLRYPRHSHTEDSGPTPYIISIGMFFGVLVYLQRILSKRFHLYNNWEREKHKLKRKA